MTALAGATLRLTLARACAWALLLAGWIGIGSLALQFAPSLRSGFALVALWLWALGVAATVVTPGAMGRGTRAVALAAGAAITGAALWWTVHGGGIEAVLLALAGWAVLTALASGVVRSLRLAHAAAPAPPVAAAAFGACCAALALGDIGDLPALATRLALFVIVIAGALVLLQARIETARRAAGCRAGLFDCSLPAWPAGAWHDPRQWPTLIAGLAMLPMMAAVPVMAAWCSARGVAPQAMVALHFAAMFAPPLLVRRWIAQWPQRRLAVACTALLAAGAACAAWAAAPLDLLGLAVTHGAAWGLAWSGQLWAPARRGRQGASPLRAAGGYALLTLGFGLVVDRWGVAGVADVHVVLGLVAVLASLFALVASARPRATSDGPDLEPVDPPAPRIREQFTADR